jgi:hypothetical protein
MTSFYVQSAISLPLPFVSILLMTRDFGRRALSRPTCRSTPSAARSLQSFLPA